MQHLAPALDAVYDVTIAYCDHRHARTGAFERPSERSLLLGRPPREVHLLLQRTPTAAMPLGDEAALRAWLAASFEVSSCAHHRQHHWWAQ
jgi:hypothetical protein